MGAFRKPVAVYLYLYTVMLACFSFTSAVTKTWIQDNNWETTRNWNPPRLPCAGDAVKIDLAIGNIFLNSTTTMKELTFQEESSIVLGNSAEILFMEENSDSNTCKGGEISFTGSGSNDWLDPQNWKTAQPKWNKIGLYSKQIPCQYDVVRFPQDSSYNVKISKNVTVANIFINGKKQSEKEFRQFVTSSTGIQRIQLNRTTSFDITGKECEDISGCICDNSKYEDYICSFVTCPKLKCDQSLVKPFAGCCFICGNILQLNFSAGFNKASMEKQIQKYLQEFPEVIFTTTKYEERRIQIILWDDFTSDNSKTFHAARSIRENLLADESMHIIAIEILPKTPDLAPQSGSKGSRALTIGSIAAGAFVFIVLVIVFVFIFFKRKHSREINTSNQDTEGEIHNVENPGYLEEGVNPLYVSDLEMDTLGFTNALANANGKENPIYEPAKPGGD